MASLSNACFFVTMRKHCLNVFLISLNLWLIFMLNFCFFKKNNGFLLVVLGIAFGLQGAHKRVFFSDKCVEADVDGSDEAREYRTFIRMPICFQAAEGKVLNALKNYFPPDVLLQLGQGDHKGLMKYLLQSSHHASLVPLFLSVKRDVLAEVIEEAKPYALARLHDAHQKVAFWGNTAHGGFAELLAHSRLFAYTDEELVRAVATGKFCIKLARKNKKADVIESITGFDVAVIKDFITRRHAAERETKKQLFCLFGGIVGVAMPFADMVIQLK
jgi:hypothetical protein